MLFGPERVDLHAYPLLCDAGKQQFTSLNAWKVAGFTVFLP